jgi:hypothetical protein
VLIVSKTYMDGFGQDETSADGLSIGNRIVSIELEMQ